MSITRHCYYQEGGEYQYQTRVELPGYLAEVVFAGYLEFPQGAYSQYDNDKNVVKSANANFRVFKDLSKFCKVERIQNKDVLAFHMMPPSFTCVVKSKRPSFMREAVLSLNELLTMPTPELSQLLFSGANLAALNHLLFRCDEEEKDISKGARGTYGL